MVSGQRRGIIVALSLPIIALQSRVDEAVCAKVRLFAPAIP
jgi:hypothetical protein